MAPCLPRAGKAAMEPESLYNLLHLPGKVDPPAEEELLQGAGRVGRRGRAGILRTPQADSGPALAARWSAEHPVLSSPCLCLLLFILDSPASGTFH